MTRKTMRNRGFEPWTFRSCLGYQHFVINDNNRDQRKKDSKKTSIATVAEIKTEANVAEKASALVAATDHGDHMTYDSRQVSPFRPSSQKIVSTTNGNTTPVIGKGSLTLTDTLNLDSVLVNPSLDYNLLTSKQDRRLVVTKDEVNLLFQNFHKMIETQYNAKTTCSNTPQQNGVAEWKNRHLLEVVLNQEAGELDMSGQQFGSEDVFIEIPNQSSSVEGVLNLKPDPFMKRLPHRHNRAIPNSVQEALADPRWKAAMNEKMKSLQKNETWELIECPPK
ncbi:hypothetical protein AAG906_001104 [Vitis piasezkii]